MLTSVEGMQYRRSQAFITELGTSACSESKRMTNHNTLQLSRMDPANHCAASPGLSRLNTRAVATFKNSGRELVGRQKIPSNFCLQNSLQYEDNFFTTLHADLGISYVQEVIHQKCNKHHTALETQENPLLKTREENRRLIRHWPIDLI
jgi:hypothetical protein